MSPRLSNFAQRGHLKYHEKSKIIIKVSMVRSRTIATIDPDIHTNSQELTMSKKSHHNADIKNANKGTPGTNITHDKNQGNRGGQLNPNKSKGK